MYAIRSDRRQEMFSFMQYLQIVFNNKTISLGLEFN